MAVRRKSTGGQGRHEKFILEAVEMIRREACDGLTAKRLIERYPQSRRNFERRFREAVGHSVLDEILHVRLEAVCALLARSGTPIGAISAMCGFPSDDALDALFRRRFGIGMRDWRRRNAYS
jgi:LacI family transcriptional regulator